MTMDHTSARIVTVSVSDARTGTEDESGRVLSELLKAAGLGVRRHHVIKDDPDYIRQLVTMTSQSEAEAMILTGGMGLARHDHTYDVVDSLFEKRVEGFGEAFRRLSFDEIGPLAMLSRATAGILSGTVIFALPGGVRAVRLGVERLIIPVIAHAMDLASGRTTHPPSAKIPIA
jgi:molybdenum cofactor biosynthesis protein B